MSDKHCRVCGKPSGTKMYCSAACRKKRCDQRDRTGSLSLSQRVEIPLHTAHDIHALGIDVDDPDQLGALLAEGVAWVLRTRE